MYRVFKIAMNDIPYGCRSDATIPCTTNFALLKKLWINQELLRLCVLASRKYLKLYEMEVVYGTLSNECSTNCETPTSVYELKRISVTRPEFR